MRKLLLFVVASLLITSCSKSKTGKGKYCYHCIFGFNAGGQPPRSPLDTCCDDNAIGNFRFVDANGNQLSSVCNKQ